MNTRAAPPRQPPDAPGRPPSRALAAGLNRLPGLPVFLATLAVYVALVPWLARVWARSGDEPHYLLAAHSLVFDGDLDLNNNYAERDYAPYYGEYYLNPHVRVRADGQAVLTHNLGLSFAIAPAYALGGLAGVLYALALIGALLAAQVFLLGYDLTGNWIAAVIGWAAIAFAPPVLWYVFLVYPEALAALGLILAARQALRGYRPHQTAARPLSVTGIVQFGLGLAILPWLSSRFLPAMALFAAWGLWRARRERSRPWLAAALLAGAGLAGYMLFSFWLYGSASPAASYAGPIPLAVERSFALQRVGRGLLGWLFDNQRGLVITAPVYLAALWGSALLLVRRPLAGLALLAPFAAALLPVAVWGGFWLGWEYSARFLIAALPLLGGGLAYLWAAGPPVRARPVIAALLAASLWSGALVVAQPIRGILSSPVEALKPRLDLEAVVPAMARFAFLPAGQGAVAGTPLAGPGSEPSELLAGAVRARLTEAPTWQAPAGESGLVLRQVDLPEFPFGWYTARLPLAAPDAGPDTPIASIRIFSPQAGDYFSATILGRDLSADGLYRFGFYSPMYNGWGHPPTVLVSATGQAALQVGMLSIAPDLFHSLGLAAVWLLAAALVGWLALRKARQPRPRAFAPPPALSLGLALLAAGSFGLSLRPQPRTYLAVDLQRTVGDAVADPAAYRGKAMQADPAAGHEPGRLAYSFAEPYGAGRYRLTISVAVLPAAEPLSPDSVLGSARVIGADAAALAQRWDFTAAGIPADGRYYSLQYSFENPKPQALIFMLDYAGTAGLKVDRLIVEAVD
ncbi:MAG: hypothetical protein IT318_03130 [Anaerolineales bacterium]|nr:hypothetical protein [Anaerolineales bacterium]